MTAPSTLEPATYPDEPPPPVVVYKVRRKRRRGRTAADRAWAAAVKARDGVCVECGATEGLHAAHIKSRKEYPELALDPENGRTLCVGCHRIEHPELPDVLFPAKRGGGFVT